jgi:hypothetical protein
MLVPGAACDLPAAQTLQVAAGAESKWGAGPSPDPGNGAGRSGALCARYVRADLPLLDQASRAGLNSVLGVGVALAVIGAAALVGAALVAMRVRKRARYKRAPVGAAPDACARGSCPRAAAAAGACRCCQRMSLSRPQQRPTRVP